MRARDARGGRTRLRTAAVAGATAAALAATLSGCVTVHGEESVVPAASRGEAAKVLRHFTAVSNKANKANDPGLNATIENGPLGAIDRAGLKARRSVHPKGNEKYEPLKLTGARFLIPKQAGWPKFFVADTRSNRSPDHRWLLVFARHSADARWKASYLSVLGSSEVPEFTTDAAGHAKAVPTGAGSGLVVPPGRLSREYVDYLQDGGDRFADGPQTSGRRTNRKHTKQQTGKTTQFVDQPAQPPQYPVFALRTEDGGAVAFFGSLHHTKEQYPRGYSPPVKDEAKALMKGKPKHSVIYSRMSQQAVSVPAKKNGGQVAFLNRIDGLTAAEGE